MDRCRCEEYAEAVKKIRFYTVGTVRPEILENYDRKEFVVKWFRKVPDYYDFKFSKPKAWSIHKGEKDPLPPKDRKIEHMWCPYMSLVKK